MLKSALAAMFVAATLAGGAQAATMGKMDHMGKMHHKMMMHKCAKGKMMMHGKCVAHKMMKKY